MKSSPSKRKRGIILSPSGLKRLEAAIKAVEITENQGAHFSIEALSERMNISTRTLNRLRSLNTPVDQKTLKLCFSSFNLKLQKKDYISLSKLSHPEIYHAPSLIETEKVDSSKNLLSKSFISNKCNLFRNFWIYPEQPVPLDSHFYIERPPIEKLVYRELTQRNCLIQIRSPQQMGKTSLVLRLLDFANKQGYCTVKLNCKQIDSQFLTNLNKLLRFFCWYIARELGIDPNLNQMWDDEIGCKLSCSFYFQNYLLKQSQVPLVLVLDDVDHFFTYPDISQEFFALLRSWNEEGRHNPIWQKLKLVVVYSAKEYLTWDTKYSLFNMGLPIRLPEFNQQQVEELAKRYGLDWSSGKESTELMSLVGGHPALIRIALYYVCSQVMTLQKLIQEAIANGGIYCNHLWQHLVKLQEKPTLAKAYAKVVTAKQSSDLDPMDTYELDSLGLIRFEGECILPSCELYRIYFQKQLSKILKI